MSLHESDIVGVFQCRQVVVFLHSKSQLEPLSNGHHDGCNSLSFGVPVSQASHLCTVIGIAPDVELGIPVSEPAAGESPVVP